MKAFSKAELRAALVRRDPDDHKGVFGHVLIAAGSRNMGGAAVLAARAALRSGAGRVTVAVPAGIQPCVAGQVPEALSLGLPENSAGGLRPEALSRLRAGYKESGYTVLAMGPGLSTHAETAKFVLLALSSLDLPAVVDADALNILAGQDTQGVKQLLRERVQPCIFTPHPGEMGRCLDMSTQEVQGDRVVCAQRLARDWRGVAVLKGRHTVISNGARVWANPTGGPGLAKGGTGDVLTGLIAGLWAQSLASGRGREEPAFGAAALGTWLHGRAGELAEAARTAYGMTAQDVVERLPDAFKELL
ncbi:MAG: NAD(P)H-hydrate dehydratase [Elusimicrobiota bacterium]|jgi:NAD(P)H-hydrate epimerase